MEYSEKLKNPKWQRKRLEILNRDNFKCCLCDGEEVELHVHHLKYTNEPHNAPNKDLETLCKYCHNLKKFFKISDYGVFLKSKVTMDGLIAINDKDEIHIFSIDNDSPRLEISFSSNSDTLHSLIEFCNNNWNTKKQSIWQENKEQT
jgi:hypothetical protein